MQKCEQMVDLVRDIGSQLVVHEKRDGVNSHGDRFNFCSVSSLSTSMLICPSKITGISKHGKKKKNPDFEYEGIKPTKDMEKEDAALLNFQKMVRNNSQKL